MKCAFFSSALLLLVPASAVNAQLVEDTNICLEKGSSSYSMKVVQELTFNCHTLISFSVDAGPPGTGTANLIFEGATLDEGSDWYLAEVNQDFTFATITAGDHLLWGTTFLFDKCNLPDPAIIIQLEIGKVFFLAVNTGFGFKGDCPTADNRNVFGWAILRVNPNLSLTMFDNAVAYGFAGIVVGQNEGFPLPTGIPGDVNHDGQVDLQDVAPFGDALVNGNYIAEADINQDGVVDLRDVAPFVALLLGG